VRMLWRALSIKPLAGSRSRLRWSGLWEFNRFLVGSYCKEGTCAKSFLLMLVNVMLRPFTTVMVRRGCSSFNCRDACTYTRGSVRRASGFVRTGNPELTPQTLAAGS
jgi:hypothetical protein